MAIKLNLSSLKRLPSNVSVPSYDRQALERGIIHVGVGNFHRAHQLVYLDQLFNLGLDHDWGVLGAGIMAGDRNMRAKLKKQDWLTTVVDLDEKGLTARICGAMIGFVETKASDLIDALTQPQIRIVSLTITEGGYFVDEKTGGFCSTHADIEHDSAHPDTPRTVFGILAASLEKRRVVGLKPFTIMSCDNLPHNGHMTRQALLGLTRLAQPTLADWIDTNVAFPNSMVDCITPATSDTELLKLKNMFGIDDAAPVFCEPFRQWVLEDHFSQGRPRLEKVGVQFVDEVAPYELMKLRILNGGHAALAFPSALMGLHYVHEAMNETSILSYLRKIVEDEVLPTLQPVPGIDFDEYFKVVIQRFSNPEVGDTISRLCSDSSNRLPKFILPIITANFDSNRLCPGLTMVVAFWCLYCAASADQNNTNITLIDESSEKLVKQAVLAQDDPIAFLEMDDVFGSLGRHPMFVEQFCTTLKMISQSGIVAALKKYSM